MKQPFSITLDDYNNSGKDYCKIDDCPATIALKRQLGIDATISPEGEVVSLPKEKLIGKIDGFWNSDNFSNLTKGIEFHTQIEIYESNMH